MAAITYTANERAPLVPGHSAGTAYSFDVKLQGFNEGVDLQKTTHVSLAGNVESVLNRASDILNIVLILPSAEFAQFQEFLFSVAEGELFSFDPYGTVAVPDNEIEVICMNSAFAIARMTHGEDHWRSLSLTLMKYSENPAYVPPPLLCATTSSTPGIAIPGCAIPGT